MAGFLMLAVVAVAEQQAGHPWCTQTTDTHSIRVLQDSRLPGVPAVYDCTAPWP